MSLVGQVHLQEMNYPKAEDFFSRAQLIHPQCKETLFAFSDFLIKTERKPEAIKMLESFGNTFTSCDRLHVKLGYAYLSVGEFDEALKNFDAALSVNPESDCAMKGKDETDRRINGGVEDDVDNWDDEGVEDDGTVD